MILTDRIPCCVAEDTRIRMGDGSEIPVNEIHPGHKIDGADGQSATVVDVISGREEQMVVIQAQGRNQIRVTAEHPLMTEKGWKTAGELTVEERILMGDGTYIPVQEYWLKAGGVMVYNLVLEGADAFVANGYVVGDFKQQMACERTKGRNVRQEPDPEILAEFEKLIKEVR